MTKIRRLALQTSLDNHFSNDVDAEVWERIKEATAIRRIEDGTYIVWEPFEYFPTNEFIKSIESLASSIENTIHLYVEEMK